MGVPKVLTSSSQGGLSTSSPISLTGASRPVLASHRSVSSQTKRCLRLPVVNAASSTQQERDNEETKVPQSHRQPNYQPTSQPTATLPPSPQPRIRGLTSHLKSLLRYSRLPLASTIEATDPTLAETSLLGDGMAAASPQLTTTATTTTVSSTPTGGATVPNRTAPSAASSRSSRFFSSRKKAATPIPVIKQDPVHIDHAALAVLRERVAAGSRPGHRTDGYKLGLVVEGGGMRGCVSGGALQALGDLGVTPAFDGIYGSSAGAINSTYFLSGQREGVAVYYDHIASQQFIDMKRFWTKKPGQAPALDLDFLIDHVMESVLPLDWDSVLSSPVPLKVVASSLDALSPVLLQDFSSKQDLAECLKASANVPEVAGTPRHHRGHRLVDAAVFEPVPFRSAIADGCTHVIVLCTRPKPVASGPLDRALSEALSTVVKRYVLSPEYMVPAWQAEMESLVKDGMSQDDQLMRSFDEDAHTLPWFSGAHVYPIYPSPHASTFSPLCIDVPTIKAGVAEGRRAVIHVLRAALGGVLDFGSLDLEELPQGGLLLPSLGESGDGDIGVDEAGLMLGSSAAGQFNQQQEALVASGVPSEKGEGGNIVPLVQLNKEIAMQRMKKRYDFSHHSR